MTMKRYENDDKREMMIATRHYGVERSERLDDVQVSPTRKLGGENCERKKGARQCQSPE